MSAEAELRSSFDHTEPSSTQPTKLTRRMRPPDLEIRANMENRAPLRGDKHGKAGKRESRLGFGRFFGRHRVVADAEAMRAARETPSSRGSEEGKATIGGTPYDLQVQSETHLAPVTDIELASRPKTSGMKSPSFTPPLGSPTAASNSRRKGSLATTAWDPVPLFQAWPQALRTATLPACLQADGLLRMHNKREMLPTINHPDLGDEKDMFVAMAKKRHRRSSSSFKLDWTTKIYILVTSGYLLQYSGDGPHDCLPEKVVQLTKDSAAFASDVIPDKHWVLQVSSVFEDGALISQDTRSLLGKFGLREKEKRQASDILMVFESAADMDSWMTLLRKEIEVLGGKAPLTETGTPKLGEEQTPVLAEALPVSPAGRTLVMRDPNFGRNGSLPGMRWDAAINIEGPELHLDTALTELLPDHSFDDNSTTNSFVSQDGRQLDGLRDSGNRYSFVSAARTIVTSDSSACNSPIRDSFGSGSQGSHPSEDATPLADEMDKMHLRPNGAEIETRRQSYRSSNALFDLNALQPTHRQHSSLSIIQEPPNFSLPNAAARRRAASHTAADHIHMSQTTVSPTATPGRPPRRPRRPPPPTLGFTRPLSIVADSPSPSRSSPMNPVDIDHLDVSGPQSSPCALPRWTDDNTKEYDLSPRASSQQSNVTVFKVSTTPRKYASMTSLRPTDHSSSEDAALQFSLPPVPIGSPLRLSPTSIDDTPRSMSAMDLTSGIASPHRSRSPIQRAMAKQKRASMYNLSTTTNSPRRGSVSVFTNNARHRSTQSDGHFAESPRWGSLPAATAPSGHKRNSSHSSTQSLSNRRSMPHMTPLVGPPPAPPPNKALPPIPVGAAKKRRSGSMAPPTQQRRMRAQSSMVNLSGGEF